MADSLAMAQAHAVPAARDGADDVAPALAAYAEDPGSAAARARVLSSARALAAAVCALPRGSQGHPLVARALQFAVQLSASGVHDRDIAAEDRASLARGDVKGGTALLAMMLTGSAWRWGTAPMLESVPPWLWGPYTTWVFAPPLGFTDLGDAERYAAFILPRLQELARLVDGNAGSANVRAAANAFLQTGSAIPLYFSTTALKRHAELRGRIVTRLLAHEPDRFEPLVMPRDGRRLRVGFLSRHFGPQTETYTTLPLFEHLDHERFEVILFSLREADTPLAEYCRRRADEFQVLPAEANAQVAILREAQLDVLVFGTNVTAVVHDLTRLAAHRLAPLQVANNSCCITSGLPTIDLFVSGELAEGAAAAADFSERLALVPGPAHAFNYEADAESPATTWSRASLGIPDDAVVFVSAANYHKIIPEMRHAWARLLARSAQHRLLLHPFNPNWSSRYPVRRFCAEFDEVLAEHGVPGERLLVSTAVLPSRSEVRELLSVGDLYLDTFPFAGVNSLIDPLELGLPVVCWEGRTFRSRMGAALLRSLQLDDLIVRDADAYHALSLHLATDAGARRAVQERIRAAMATRPIFLDRLAASDAFGAVLEAAYDRLVSAGRAAFRADPTPIRAEPDLDVPGALATGALMLETGAIAEAGMFARRILAREPDRLEARVLLGRALLRQGRAQAAADYLLAAVDSGRAPAEVWRELSAALKAAGNFDAAMRSLETALRIDPEDRDGWRMLAEAAKECGHADLLAHATAMLARPSADDPRLGALAGADARGHVAPAAGG